MNKWILSALLMSFGYASPAALLTPTQISFNTELCVNAAATVEVRNTCQNNTCISPYTPKPIQLNIHLSGDDVNRFNITSTCGRELGVAQACLISVRPTTNQPGTFSAVLHISDTDAVPLSLNVTASGELIITPQPVAFIGQTTQTLTISHSSGLPVVVSAINLDNPLNFAVLSNNCVNTNLGLGSCQVELSHLTPGGSQPEQGGLHIVSGPVNNPQCETHTVMLTGNPEAGISVTPDQVDFNLNRVCPAGPSVQQVTLTNTGFIPLQVMQLGLEGSHPEAFTLQDSCSGQLLNSGEACSVNVDFIQQDDQPRSAILTLPTNLGSRSVPLQGLSVAPALQISPAAVRFTDSLHQTIQVCNQGSAPINITGVDLSGAQATDFTLDRDTCSGTPLEANGCATGKACALDVTFKQPLGALGQRAQLNVQTDCGAPYLIPLSGDGVNVCLLLPDQNELTFTSTEPLQTVIFSNAGSVSATPSLIGINSDAFTVSNHNCASPSLAPGATCQVDLRYTPPISGVPYSAVLNVDSGCGSNVPVTLIGTPSLPQGCLISSSPSHLDFSAANPEQIIQVRNDSPQPITITPDAMPAYFSLITNDCVGVLPGANCQIGMRFLPPADGRAIQATYGIQADCGTRSEVTLVGSPLVVGQCLLEVAPQDLTFSSTLTSQELLLSNTGSLALTPAAALNNQLDFSVTGNTCTTLNPGETCRLRIDFNLPADTSLRQGTLSVDSLCGIQHTVNLYGSNGSNQPLPPAVITDIPTLSEWGLMMLSILVLFSSLVYVRQR